MSDKLQTDRITTSIRSISLSDSESPWIRQDLEMFACKYPFPSTNPVGSNNSSGKFHQSNLGLVINRLPIYSLMMPWKKMLACVTGQIEDSLRQKLDYVLAENRVYRALLDRHSPSWRLARSASSGLANTERKNLAEKGKPLGKLLKEVITIAKPETLLKWHRRLVAKKWDYSFSSSFI